MKDAEFFARTPVFTYEEYVESVGSSSRRSRKTVESQLRYHVEAGHLVRLRRGLYATVPPLSDAATFRADPYIVASKLAEDAVLAYHSALEFYGRAYSVHYRLLYLTDHPKARFRHQDHTYQYVRFPKSLRDVGKEQIEIKQEEYRGMRVRVTTYERTLVDVLDRLDLSGGWEEAWRSLEMVEHFNLSHVVEYALLLGNAVTTAKVGFFLEQHREELMVEDETLKKLRALRPRHPYAVERGTGREMRYLSDWNLVLPQIVVERGWEDVG